MNEQPVTITLRRRNLLLLRSVKSYLATSQYPTPYNQVISMIKGLQEHMANMDKVLTDSIRCFY